MDSLLAKDAEKSCVLCCQDADIVALGKCEHPVCYKCSTKMRVLCGQRYCAVCREELDKVVFVRKCVPFVSVNAESLQCEKKHDIYFSDGKIYAQYRRILQSECSLCTEMKVFSRFEELEQHMRKQHELFCCKLCVKHLRIFTYERKWYNRKDLARHRTQGDPDDTSHRGHPLCKFCDDRYLDNDELLKHLRKDHYFCHFCDADGAQEYYSDYTYLREHFRESHYLCEEGHCSMEQFTHAFRSEIDYKAHKAAAHSKSRAEARQNRHIELQFSYAPRHTRRNDGIGSDDYEEVDRFNRHMRTTRGAPSNRRGSWRYSREVEEDREVAAALRASLVAHRQTRREERMDVEEDRNHKAESLNAKNPVRSSSKNDFPVLGSAVVPVPPAAERVTQTPSLKLVEDDFPSLSGMSVSSTPITPAYTAPPRKTSSFQEEDFPALVSKIRPHKTATVGGPNASAWAQSANRAVSSTSVPPLTTGPAHSKKSSNGSMTGKAPSRLCYISSEDEEEPGRSVQDIRSIPTMLDISSLLTSKPCQPAAKPGKRRKQPMTSTVVPPAAAQKENVPETPNPPKAPPTQKPAPVSNGRTDLPAGCPDPPTREPPGFTKQDPKLSEEEEFPALVAKKPPPGFRSSFPVKCVTDHVPSPPPGLMGSKPPPGFTGIPLNDNAEPPFPALTQPGLSMGSYIPPENYQQRNKDLIQSITDYLQHDQTKFNLFKAYSGQFRQGVISALQYHQRCQELLGENFSRIFNELLVLLPDTDKQQELLAVHRDSRASGKTRKGKKSVWQSGSANNNEPDYQTCPTCRQVLAQSDVLLHKTLHMGNEEDFPSLQAISRIIS